MTSIENWGTCLVFVSGASKGFGAAICEEFSKVISSESVIIGLARTKTGLERTGETVCKCNPKVKFVPKEMDLTNVEGSVINQVLKTSFKDDVKFDRAILVHNVGSLGSLDYIRNIDCPSTIKLHTDLNYCSIYSTTSSFVKFIEETQNQASIHVINISSLAAIQPIKATGMYCAMKAARDMMFKVLATEEPKIDVLNYAPGPLKTDMQIEIRECCADADVKSSFQALKDKDILVDVNLSAAKMISLIATRSYKSGDHVDFYD